MTTIALVVLGIVAMGIGAIFGRRAGALESELVQYRSPRFRGFEGRWPAPPDLRYRPEGWPLVTSLRRALLVAYVFVIAGVMVLLYAWPRLQH
jgi:hypothetical protein